MQEQVVTNKLQFGPGLGPEDEMWPCWRTLLLDPVAGSVSVNRGWDLAWERARWSDAANQRIEHLSVRLYRDEVLIGPRWTPGSADGCAGCAEARDRIGRDHPLAAQPDQPRERSAIRVPVIDILAGIVIDDLVDHPLRPGELLALGVHQAVRHRILRTFHCPVCRRPRLAADPGQPPARPRLHSRAADPSNPTRGRVPTALLQRNRLRAAVVDQRFGPVREILRESRSPFAMSMAFLPEATTMGYGRAVNFATSEPIAALEAYERLAGFPHEAPVVANRAFAELGDAAVDPTTLGQYSAEQLAHPRCRVTRYSPETHMDWVWGHDLATGEATLVPADIGFYQYEYRHGLDRLEARRHPASEAKRFFHQSSSGCALGSSYEEAALHSLLELAERDAFLLCWYRAAMLPRIRAASVRSATSHLIMDLIEARGFELHLLAAADDLKIPTVWALAVNARHSFPATFSAAGSSVEPESAVLGALWELAQVLTDPHDWERAEVERMAEDPWRVTHIEDHIRLYTLPERRARVTRVLGGANVDLDQAFPGWPDCLTEAADGDVLGALRYVAGLFADAGLDRIVLVDQSTSEHRDLGLAVMLAVVPGITPMCFGYAEQRFENLPRLAHAAMNPGTGDTVPPYDPHPFP